MTVDLIVEPLSIDIVIAPLSMDIVAEQPTFELVVEPISLEIAVMGTQGPSLGMIESPPGSGFYVIGVMDGLDDPAWIVAVEALYAQCARNPDQLINGTVVRDSNNAAISADVLWPDGTPGEYVADTLSTDFPGAVDGYHITYGSPVTKTYTQPDVTRNASGAVITLPAIVVT